MAPTPSSKSNQILPLIKTPQSKQRLHFAPKSTQPPLNPDSKDQAPPEHPVEVIGRIRDHPDRKEKHASILQVIPEKQTIRVRADIGYRDFTLDGVSLSEEQDLDTFYKRFIESRINGVKVGKKCTIMMYGPTGSGKSHTMFGSGKQPGIVYRSLRDILGDGEREGDGEGGIGMFVQVTVLEIYNEEIYDLLSSNTGGGFGIGWPKNGGGSKVRLEVMGKKAKNATFISGTEAGRISKEIQKVEKRRIVKSTLCNDRSSRSHCMIILDVPTVGGRLMLVDMAGSENIEQAGQNGHEAKMQTAKINQGNIALKRVVESIANGDSHVPFRDSKLTMLLQDSFEDDKSKILMILCASPDPKEIHKTICTLEYGAKAKCIIRGPHTPNKDKHGAEDSSSSAVILGSRIAAMDQFIYKLQMENKLREKERNDAHKQLTTKEEEVAALRALLERKGSGADDEEKINEKVNERTETLKRELEQKLEECRRMAEEFVEMERRRMEERILQQQEEVEMLRRRLEEIEFEFQHSRGQNGDEVGFAKRLVSLYGDEDMVKSMDLDMGDQEREVKQIINVFASDKSNVVKSSESTPRMTSDEVSEMLGTKLGDRVCLSTVFEEGEFEEEESSREGDDEEEKVIVEDKRVCSSTSAPQNPGFSLDQPTADSAKENHCNGLEDDEYDHASSRRLRIQNIFELCGNRRELLSHNPTNPIPCKNAKERVDTESPDLSKENCNPCTGGTEGGEIEVYVKWEASRDQPGKFITTLKVVKDATLTDLRKLIEIHLGRDNQAFSFLVLGDPSGAPVRKEEESTFMATKLPLCNGHLRLLCLRPGRKSVQNPSHEPMSPLPLNPVENKMPLTPIPGLLNHQRQGALSPAIAAHLSSTPFVTRRRR